MHALLADRGRVCPVVGARDVLVPESALEAAREALAFSAEQARAAREGAPGAEPAG